MFFLTVIPASNLIIRDQLFHFPKLKSVFIYLKPKNGFRFRGKFCYEETREKDLFSTLLVREINTLSHGITHSLTDIHNLRTENF